MDKLDLRNTNLNAHAHPAKPDHYASKQHFLNECPSPTVVQTVLVLLTNKYYPVQYAGPDLYIVQVFFIRRKGARTIEKRAGAPGVSALSEARAQRLGLANHGRARTSNKLVSWPQGKTLSPSASSPSI